MRLWPGMATGALQEAVVCAHVLAVTACCPKQSPLGGYLELNANHMEAFFLCGPSDEASVAVSAVTGSHRRYRCACGETYLIADCGRPAVQATCNKCKNVIGGLSHVLAAGNVAVDTELVDRVEAVDKRGYIADPQALHEDFYTVRDLKPKTYRVLHLIVHLCLAAGQEARVRKQWSGLGVSLGEVYKHIENDLRRLQRQFESCSRELICGMIHSVVETIPGFSVQGPLSSSGQRVAWEAAFQNIHSRTLDNPREAASNYIAGRQEMVVHSELRSRIQERADPDAIHLSAEARNTRLTRILRVHWNPSLDGLQAYFLQNPSVGDLHPVLRLFLEHEDDLPLLQHIGAIVAWTNFVREKAGCQISRTEALTISVDDFIRQEEARSKDAKSLFASFANAWNALRDRVHRFGCHEFKEPIPLMTRGSPLALSCLETRRSYIQGMYSAGMLEYLIGIHNNFLTALAPLIQASDTLRQLALSKPDGTIYQTQVQVSSASAILCYDREWMRRTVSELAICGSGPGNGARITYDLTEIEHQVATHHLVAKSLFTMDGVEDFPYGGEVFQQHATLLSDIGDKVVQDSAPEEVVRFLEQELKADSHLGGAFLKTLSLALCRIKATGGNPDETFQGYCNRWLGVHGRDNLLQSPELAQAKVRHAVSMYHVVEDTLSASILHTSVHPQYMAPLPEDVKADLLQLVVYRQPMVAEFEQLPGARLVASQAPSTRMNGGEANKINGAALATVLRRFTFRYLANDAHRCDDPLGVYICDTRLVEWPEGSYNPQADLEDLIPMSLLVKHAFSAYQLLQQRGSAGSVAK